MMIPATTFRPAFSGRDTARTAPGSNPTGSATSRTSVRFGLDPATLTACYYCCGKCGSCGVCNPFVVI